MRKDKARFEAFLCFLSYNGNLTISAENSGLSVSTIRRHRRADLVFAEAVKDALDAAADRLRYEAWQRAVHGEDVPYFYQGVQVGIKKRRSDQLMGQLLRVLSTDDNASDSHAENRAELVRQLTEKLAQLTETDACPGAGETD